MDHTTETLLEIINKLSKITVYKKKHTKIWAGQIFLGRGNKRDLVSRGREDGQWNMNNQVVGTQRERVLKETTGKGGHFRLR